jgi:hypothetical protein
MGRNAGPTGGQTLSAVVRAYGEQLPRVRAAVNGGPKDSGYVAVTLGSTLTYCYDLLAVESFATAWAEATTRPTQWLAETTDEVPSVTGCQLAVQVSVVGSQQTDVRLVAAQASAEGRAHLAVRVGRVVTVVFDRAALAGYRQAWAEALDYGRRIFTNPEPDAFDEIESRIRERERRHFERTGQVSQRR